MDRPGPSGRPSRRDGLPRGNLPKPTAGAKRRASARSRTPKAAAFHTLVEDSDEGMLLVDAGGIVTYANAASERYLGHGRAALIGRSGFDLCRPEDVACAREVFARALAQPGRALSANIGAPLATAPLPRLAVKLVNRLPTPGVNAIVVQFHGTTVSDAADDHESVGEETAYRLLFEGAPVGLCVSDVKGNLLAFNDAMLRPGGYTREEICAIGNVARLYASAADRKHIVQLARDKGYVWREEAQFLRKDGTRYDTLLSLTPVRFRGRDCWYAAVEDISAQKRAALEREQLETQLRQAQKMEAVGRMTGGVAHDFNNILSVIMANAGLVTAALESGGGDVENELSEIRRAARRGASMIRKLLGFSRNFDLDIAPTDVGAVVEQLEQMLRHVVPEHIVLRLDTTTRCIGLCDADAVEQVIMNLATNARDAMPEGGVIRIGVTKVHVDAESAVRPQWLAAGDFVRISVADTGVGMDAETLARAMEPFFTTKAVGSGSGLGLAMVYGLVKQQGGFINIRSEQGRGTTVELYFPWSSTPPRKHRDTPTRASIEHGTATILLLEDDDSLRRTGERVLEHLGYRVLLAEDGNRGLAMFREHTSEIDLVLSDMVMPGLTGSQVYEAIRELHPTVPFLLSSGYQERVERTFTVPPGVVVVPKPWTIEELARVIRQTLDLAP